MGLASKSSVHRGVCHVNPDLFYNLYLIVCTANEVGERQTFCNESIKTIKGNSICIPLPLNIFTLAVGEIMPPLITDRQYVTTLENRVQCVFTQSLPGWALSDPWRGHWPMDNDGKYDISHEIDERKTTLTHFIQFEWIRWWGNDSYESCNDKDVAFYLHWYTRKICLSSENTCIS